MESDTTEQKVLNQNLKLPKVDTMFYLRNATEDNQGIDELNAILKLKKIR